MVTCLINEMKAFEVLLLFSVFSRCVYAGNTCADLTCSQNCSLTPSGPECYCNDGYRLDYDDNSTCLDINECSHDDTCSQRCTNLIGGYKCSCLNGYELINRTCQAAGSEPLLIFATVKYIRIMNLRSGHLVIAHTAVGMSYAIDTDPLNPKMYWLETKGLSSVHSSNIDGTDYSVILSSGLKVAEDISVDYIAKNLYITDSGLNQILVCKMDGSLCYAVHDFGIAKPRSIVVDPPEGFLYWSDWGVRTAGIYRSGMDGSNKVALVSENIGYPNGIALDHTTDRLFWVDASLKTIEYITLDGSTRKVILKDSVHHPYSLAVFEDILYWSDWSTFSLESCNKFSGHEKTIFQQFVDKHRDRVMGVHVHHPIVAKNLKNPCRSNPCSHMCLLAPHRSYRCVGPPEFNTKKNENLQTDSFPVLFVNDNTTIYQLNPELFQSPDILEIPINDIEVICRVAYDGKAKSLFVMDMKQPAIYAINMTSLIRRELVKEDMILPEDLAFDSVNDNLYWVDSTKGTVEVISTLNLQKAIIVKDLAKPVAIALAPTYGLMFVSTIGDEPKVAMYDMDGRNQKVLTEISGAVMFLAVHPSKSVLYWADLAAEIISSTDYLNSQSGANVVRLNAGNVTSVAVSEKYVYWTDSKNQDLNILADNEDFSYVLSLPGIKNEFTSPKVTYAYVPLITTNTSENSCSVQNGDCSHLCLTSPEGRSCICPTGLHLSKDKTMCTAASVDCPEDQFPCSIGKCIPSLWRCDGESDCENSIDETHCNETECDMNAQFRCDYGQCIPISWVCDTTSDCFDGSDEKDCRNGKELRACNTEEFRCLDGKCIDKSLICNDVHDCQDQSDEANCTYIKPPCNDVQFRCDDGLCIYDHEVCDGLKDCSNEEDESNCTSNKIRCTAEDKHFCDFTGRCISLRWLCDGDDDCGDASDENPEKCKSQEDYKPFPICPEHACNISGECVPWSKVCDGKPNCRDLTDEGPLCSETCIHNYRVCSQICRETPQGPRCSCFAGFALLPDGKTCEDLNECLIPDTCSQFCNNTEGGFTCSCEDGYFLVDNKTCRADGEEATLLYFLYNNIKGIQLNTRISQMYLSDDNIDARGMDYDADERVLFYSDLTKGVIIRRAMDSNKQEVLAHFPERPYFVKWDWIAKNIYFTDDHGSIRACNLHGKLCTNVIKRAAKFINGFEISPTSGLMFWSVWGNANNPGMIERAEMDGSKRIVIVFDGTRWPSSIAVDHVRKMLYWTDLKKNVLETSDFHGLNRRQIIAGNLHHPYGLALFEDSVYVADWGKDKIIRCNKFTGQNCQVFHEGNVKSEGLMIVHKAKQPKGINRCSSNICPEICLQTRTSFVCKCDDESLDNTCKIKHILQPKPELSCPDNYCSPGMRCIVISGKYFCYPSIPIDFLRKGLRQIPDSE